MKTKRLTENQINYNIFNALNLFSEELGEDYLNGNFNPFNENFKLTEDFVIERFENQQNKPPEVVSPEFVEGGVNKTKLAFNQSITNCNLTLAEVERALNAPQTSPTAKKYLLKLKTYLLCRIQLLNINLKNLKKNKNTLKMYLNVEGLDYNTSKLFEQSYKEMLDVQTIISAYVNMQHQQNAKINKQNQILKQMAKEIIKQNQQKIAESKAPKQENVTEQQNIKPSKQQKQTEQSYIQKAQEILAKKAQTQKEQNKKEQSSTNNQSPINNAERNA